jgi:hypothetical protein
MAVGLVAVSVLYVLSSGPMQTVAFHRYFIYEVDGNGVHSLIGEDDPGVWWPIAYAPLVWASGESWGWPVKWYWAQFPIQSTNEYR